MADRSNKQRAGGWTLLELMMVVMVAATLLSLTLSTYSNARQRALATQAMTDLSRIVQSIERFRFDHQGQLPASLADIGMDQIRDPWGNPYLYLNFALVKGKGQMRKDHNLVPINTEFDLYSSGPDGRSQSPLTARASRDDIIVANDGAYIGRASDY